MATLKDLHKRPEGECLFCGAPGGPHSNKEDVTSDWFLKRFPPDAKLQLPNFTALSDMRVQVPACITCNDASKYLEDKMQDESFTLLEAYVWAFKVHAGLLYMDLWWRKDITDPNSDTFGGPYRNRVMSDINDFRSIFAWWRRGALLQPLGSVFKLNSLIPGKADLSHGVRGYVAVNLDTKFVAVALFDRWLGLEQSLENAFSESELTMHLGRSRDVVYDNNARTIHLQDLQRFWFAELMHSTLPPHPEAAVAQSPVPPCCVYCIGQVGLEQVREDDGSWVARRQPIIPHKKAA